MQKRSLKKKDLIEEKLEYLGLNLSDIPEEVLNFERVEISKFYDEKQYRRYCYVPINDIQILLSPTNRLDEIEEKLKKASPLADYLDSENEENFIKHTTFLQMLKQVKISEIEKIEEEQEKLIIKRLIVICLVLYDYATNLYPKKRILRITAKSHVASIWKYLIDDPDFNEIKPFDRLQYKCKNLAIRDWFFVRLKQQYLMDTKAKENSSVN